MDEELRNSEPVPYEDGDHCIFYAVQAASQFFNKKPLTKGERDRYQYDRGRREKLLKKFVGKESWLGGDLQLSVSILINKLREKDIEPRKYIISEDSRQIIESIAQVRRGGVPIESVPGGSSLDFELPAMMVTQREGDVGHVWCPTTEEELDQDYEEHIGEGDRVVLVVELQKRETNSQGGV